MVSQASSQPGSSEAKTSVFNSSQDLSLSALEDMAANVLAQIFGQAEGTTPNIVSVVQLIQDISKFNASTPPHTPSQDMSFASLLMALITCVQNHNLSVAQTNLKTKSDEIVVNLNTRVAVLENELKHAQQEKSGLLTRLTTVIGLTSDARLSVHSSPVMASDLLATANSQELEREIERLRKENKGLRSKLRDFHTKNAANLQNSDTFQEFPPPTLASEPTVKIERDHEDLITPPLPVRKFDEQNLLSVALDMAGSWAIKQQGCSPSEGFLSDPSIDKPRTSPDSDDLQNKNVDVGIRSLEDILEGEEFGDPTALPPTPRIQGKSQSILPLDEPGPEFYLPDDFDIEDEKCIDEAVAAMNKFHNYPAPGVLKVGETTMNSVRGYDPTVPIAPLGPRGWINNVTFRRQGKPFYNHRRHQGQDFYALCAQYEGDIQNDSLSFPNSMWETREEREAVLRNHLITCGDSKEMRFPDFFKYGIQFVPGKDDGNFMRTVHIEGLPFNVEMRELLAKVRGGDIMSATILDTKKIVGSMSAMVVFKLGADASEYVKWIADHPLNFASSEGETKHAVTVTLISTPTFPPNPRIKSCLSISSRCICIPDFPADIPIKYVKMAIGTGNKTRNEPMIEIWLDERNALHMEFCSIAMAMSAMDFLSCRHNYRNLGIEVRFENDPCAGSVEGLLEDVEPRPTLSLDELLKGRKAQEPLIFEDKPVWPFNTKIKIPSFTGEKFNTASWADEVIDEIEAGHGNGSKTTVELVLPPPKVSMCVNIETLELLADDSNFGVASLASSRYGTPAGFTSSKLAPSAGLSSSKYAAPIVRASNKFASPSLVPAGNKYTKPAGLSANKYEPPTVFCPQSLSPLPTSSGESSKDMSLAKPLLPLSLDNLIAENSISDIESEVELGLGSGSHALRSASTLPGANLKISSINAEEGREKPGSRFSDTGLASFEASTEEVSAVPSIELADKACSISAFDLAKNPRRSFGKFIPPSLKR